jgi:hypothetical protein
MSLLLSQSFKATKVFHILSWHIYYIFMLFISLISKSLHNEFLCCLFTTESLFQTSANIKLGSQTDFSGV